MIAQISKYQIKTAPRVVRMFRSKAATQVRALEDALEKLHWHDSEDKLQEIHNLMEESKTNHAVMFPDQKLDYFVAQKLENLQELLATKAIDRSEFFHDVSGLKQEVKKTLYKDCII